MEGKIVPVRLLMGYFAGDLGWRFDLLDYCYPFFAWFFTLCVLAFAWRLKLFASLNLVSVTSKIIFFAQKNNRIFGLQDRKWRCFVMSYAFSSKDQISLHFMKISDDDWWSIQYFALNPFYFLKSCYVLISIFFEGLSRSACIIISYCIRSYLWSVCDPITNYDTTKIA